MSDPPALRSSDEEREHAVGLLREASAEGRLTLDEFSQRVEAAYAARTADVLAELTSDLPVSAGRADPPNRRSKRFTISIFGGVDRKGRWRIAQAHWVVSIFGGSDLDFRQASLDGGEATVYVLDMFGGTDLYVPEGIDVDFGGVGILGGADQHGRDVPTHYEAPALRVRALSFFGGTDLWRVPAGATGTRKELRKAARTAEREELPK
jgi:hypothetical protein